jgi:hypothetical protein
MIITTRIPAVRDFTLNGMRAWFAHLDTCNLLFHPDDPPETLISIESGQPFFNTAEVFMLTSTIDRLFALHGDQVYEAAYPLFLARMGIEEDV